MMTAAAKKLAASMPNGTIIARPKSSPPSGGPMSSLVSTWVEARREPARTRSYGSTVAGTNATLELSTMASADASSVVTT